MNKLTEAQALDNRKIVMSEMRSRQDEPFRGLYYNGSCSYCGVGFMLEVYRFHAKDEVLCWSYLNDHAGHLLTNYIGTDGPKIESGSWKVRRDMMDWLGIDLGLVDEMVSSNDHPGEPCTWEDLATMLENAPYYCDPLGAEK